MFQPIGMKPAAYLRDRLPEILERLENFARVRRDDVPALVAYLRASLQASAGRAAGGAQAARKRAEANVAAILDVAQHIPAGRPLHVRVHVIRSRLKSRRGIELSETTVRRAIVRDEERRKDSTEPFSAPVYRAHNLGVSTSPTT